MKDLSPEKADEADCFDMAAPSNSVPSLPASAMSVSRSEELADQVAVFTIDEGLGNRALLVELHSGLANLGTAFA